MIAGASRGDLAATTLVLSHFVVGAVFFCLMTAVLAADTSLVHGQFLDPRAAGAAHLFVLGWISTTICGALIQFVPVISGRPLFSLRLAWGGFFLWLAGLVSFPFILALRRVDAVFLPALVLYAGAVLFAVQMLVTIARAPRERGLWIIASAVSWFLATTTGGFLLALHLRFGMLPVAFLSFLRWHVYTGMAGWFLLSIVGAGVRLFPMFLLSHAVSYPFARTAAVLINAGLVAAAVATIAPVLPFQVAALFIGGGFVSFWFFLNGAFRSRMKRKDIVLLTQARVGIGIIGLAWLVSWTDYPIAALLTAAGGVGLTVAGLTFKIVPFLKWMRLQSVGGNILPAGLVPERLLKVQAAAFATALLCLIPGALIHSEVIWSVGKAVLAVTALLSASAMFLILTHKGGAVGNA